jgi:serine/threonine-protein kinase RsbW
MKAEQTVEIFIPSELGYEKVAISAVASLARWLGFSGERIDDLKTALAEAVTNAIEHGNLLDVQLKVHIVAEIDKNALILKVIDQGLQPLPCLTLPRQPRADHRGLGMFLIKKLMDEVKAITAPSRNELQMIMYLA